MEDKELAKLRVDLRGYQEIIEYYRENPSEIREKREQLSEINHSLFHFSPPYLHSQFGEEIGDEVSALVSAMNVDLIKLLLQN